ncbi:MULTISPECIES: MEDS domain-containing protein [Kitasatospora]|uniref:Putative antagonist protein n=1 Tax=Kitasatospora setae (strain ATCC 33774 / DSM 43861 / JCM 3304 / KCC A-0304 / NBRC 14216 / KM-6054) TaxID=452652 RepID=E4NJP3_KITSK|nr:MULTISPECIES: MEDS domain-containing protein [Kitasatospora]BAJ33191.1 putative antagonist protein [Kitasatospora setae KM-6054]
MRNARTVPTLEPVDAGDHVCWLVGPGDDFTMTARAFAADGALFGDKVLLIGAPDARWSPDGAPQGVVVDPLTARADGAGWNAAAMLDLVVREADTASRQGFRALRVLARMDRVWPGSANPREIARHELDLDRLAVARTAVIVCAYHRFSFRPDLLEQASGVHPHHLGTRTEMPGFRMYSVGTDCWSVSGVVDSDGADAFRTALDELVARSSTLRLRCEELELMDAAGMRALVDAARRAPGRRIVIEKADETFRHCWSLLGYDVPQIPVELAP